MRNFFLVLLPMAYALSGLAQVKDFQNFEAVNSGNSDFGYSPTGTQAVFTSNRKDFKRDHNYYKVYQYDQGQSKLQRMVSIPAKYNVGPACAIPGSTDMIVSLNKPVKVSEGQKALMELWRVSAKGKLTRLKVNGKDYSCMHPSVSPDGKYLYFASDKSGGLGGFDLYRAELLADGQTGEAQSLGAEINSASNDVFPLAHKEGQLSYASNKGGGLGGYDVYLAFPGKSGNFRYMMHPESPVNSAGDDFYLYMGEGLAYMASNREGGKGDDDIYKMTLEKPFSPFSTFAELVLTDSSGNTQANKKIIVTDRQGEVVYETQTNDKGQYNLTLISEEANKIMVADQLSKNVEPGKNFKSDMLLMPTEKAMAAGKILATTGEAIGGAQVVVVDASGAVLAETSSDGEGNYKLSYPMAKGSAVRARKEGYTESVKDINPGQKISEVNLNLVRNQSKAMEQFVFYFAPSSDQLDRQARQSLDSLARWVKSCPEEFQIELNGHADYKGTEEFNQKLGQRRAASCQTYLRSKGLKPSQIVTSSQGESKPANECVEGTECSDEKLAKNRRVEALLKKK